MVRSAIKTSVKDEDGKVEVKMLEQFGLQGKGKGRQGHKFISASENTGKHWWNMALTAILVSPSTQGDQTHPSGVRDSFHVPFYWKRIFSSVNVYRTSRSLQSPALLRVKEKTINNSAQTGINEGFYRQTRTYDHLIYAICMALKLPWRWGSEYGFLPTNHLPWPQNAHTR